MSVNVSKVDAKKLTVKYNNAFYHIGEYCWKQEYVLTSGKWKKSSDTNKVISSAYSDSNVFTADENFQTYTTAGGNKKAFYVKAGDKVIVKRICGKKGNGYLQIENLQKKKGWFLLKNTGIDRFREIYMGFGDD